MHACRTERLILNDMQEEMQDIAHELGKKPCASKAEAELLKSLAAKVRLVRRDVLGLLRAIDAGVPDKSLKKPQM